MNGNGGGGGGNGGAEPAPSTARPATPCPVAADPVTTTNAANRDYAQPVHVALDASSRVHRGQQRLRRTGSDGLTQLDRAHALTATYTDAAQGNLVQTARVDLAAGRDLTLAIGFGATQGEAVGTAGAALRTGFGRALVRYAAGWAATTPGWSRRRRASPGSATPPPASCAASGT